MGKLHSLLPRLLRPEGTNKQQAGRSVERQLYSQATTNKEYVKNSKMAKCSQIVTNSLQVQQKLKDTVANGHSTFPKLRNLI